MFSPYIFGIILPVIYPKKNIDLHRKEFLMRKILSIILCLAMFSAIPNHATAATIDAEIPIQSNDHFDVVSTDDYQFRIAGTSAATSNTSRVISPSHILTEQELVDLNS